MKGRYPSTRDKMLWRLPTLLVAVLLLTMAQGQVIFNETFTGGASSEGFTIVQNIGTTSWVYGDPGARYPGSFSGAGFDAEFAMFDSDIAGSGAGDASASLVSPTFDASVGGSYILDFDQSYRVCCGSTADVEVWNGTTWNNVLAQSSTIVGYPTADHQTIDITAAAGGSSTAQVRFTYHGDWDYWWALDNISVTYNSVCTSVEAGSTAASVTQGCGMVASSTLSLTGATTGVSGLSYQWQYDDGGGWTDFGTDDATQVVTNVSTTTSYQCIVTCTNGGAMDTSDPAATITIDPVPTVTITPTDPGPFCATANTVLNASGADTYSWSPAAGLDDPLSASPTCTATTTTNYTVTGTVTATGCTNTASVGITVQPDPVINSLTADPNPICIGNNSQLNVDAPLPAYIMGSSGSSFIDISSTGTAMAGLGDDGEGNITFPSFTYNGVAYTGARVGSNGAMAFGATTGDVGFTNAALPTTVINTTFLAPWWDDGYQITADAASQVYTEQVGDLFIIQWNNYGHCCTNTAGVDITYQVQLDVVTNTIYFAYDDVTYGGAQAANDLGASATIGIQWSGTDFLQYSFNTAGIAAGQVISFTPVTAIYSWVPSTYLDDPSIANPLASSVLLSTNYTVTVTNSASNCSTSGMIALTASDPITTAHIDGNLAYCTGGTTMLTAVPDDGGGPFTYLWSPGGETTESITVGATGLYSCQVTDNCGGSVNTGDVNVTENALPSVAVTPTTDVICDGVGSVALTASGADTYEWSPAAGLDATTGTSVNATPTSTTTYTVTGTDANGCQNTADALVNTGTSPMVNSVTADPNPICFNGSTQLDVDASVAVPYVRISEVVTFRTGVNGGTYPAYVDASVNDFIELNNTSIVPADISGWTIGDYASGAAAPTHPLLTFPTGTVIAPNGALIVGMGTGSGGSPANNYFVMGGSNDFWGSSSSMGVVLKDAASNVVDAMARGTSFTWNAATGVTASDWSGIAPGVSGNAGTVRYVASDSNTGADWINSGASATYTVTMGVYNSAYGYVNPDAGTVASYDWSPAGDLDDPSLQSPTASNVAATTLYTVTVTSDLGCSSSGDVEVVTSPPITTAHIDGTLAYCAGGSTELTAVPDDGGAPFTYSWSPGGETTASITVSTPGNYDCQVFDDCGANVNTGTVTVVENPLPNVTVDPTMASSCDGAPVALTAMGADTYAWSPAAGLDATTGANVNATPASTTTYTVTGTDANGCENTADADVVAGNAPVITSISADPNPTCFNGTSQLAVDVAGASAYCSVSVTTSCDESIGEVIFNTIDYTSGCGSYFDYTGTSTTVNVGTPYAITVNNGGNAYTADAVTAWIDWNQNGDFTDAGEAYVLASDGTGAQFTGSITPPASALSGSTRMRVRMVWNTTPAPCGSTGYGETEDYTVVVAGGASGVSYAWTPSADLDDPTIANPVASNINASTDYTVVVTDGPSGCTSTDMVTVSPTDPITTAHIDGTPAFCTGLSTTLTAVPDDGAGPYTYLWSPNGETTASITVSTAGSYNCQVFDNCGSDVNTGGVTVVENALPVVTVDPTSAASCDGAPVALTAMGADTYGWSPAAGLNTTTGATVNATPTLGTTYTVTGTDANGCQNTADAVVNVGTAPVVTSVTSDPDPTCIGGTTQLNATATVSGYTVGSSGSSFIDISATGTAMAGLGDDGEGNITFPSFTYNGVAYTGARVGSNGVMAFGATTGDVGFTNAALPTTVINTTFLAPWWDDGYQITADAASQVYTEQVGDLFIIQWNNYGHCCTNTAGVDVTFQVQLDVVTGAIYFAYDDVTYGGAQAANDGGSSATIGIQWSATDYLQYSFNTPGITVGQVIAFTPNTADIFSWTPIADLDDPSIMDPTASNVFDGQVYTVEVSTSIGCSSQGTVTLHTTPPMTTAHIEGDMTVCTGGTTTLTAVPDDGAGPYTYLWSPNGETTASIDADMPGDYSCQVMDACGGSANTGIQTLTSIPGPTITVDVTSANICPGDPAVAITASGADTYEWSPTDGLDDPLAATVNATPGATTTYTVTGTIANGCFGTTTSTITVGEVPQLGSATASPSQFCDEPVQLGVILGASPYCSVSVTTNCDESIGEVIFNTIDYTSGCGTYFDYTGTSTTVSTGTAYDITVNNGGNPYTGDAVTAWIDWNQNGDFTDAGEAYVLTGDGVGNTWTGSITPPATAYDGATRMRVRMVWNTTPAPCGSTGYGETEDYTVVVTGGVPAPSFTYTYAWTPAGDLDDPNIQNPIAMPTGNTTYTVTATSLDGCTASTSVDVVSFCYDECAGAQPVTVNPDNTYCPAGGVEGDNSSATDSGNLGCIPGGQDVWYSFTANTSGTGWTFSNFTFSTLWVEIFEGSCNGSSVGCYAGLTALENGLPTTPGQTYYMRVASDVGTGGTYNLCLYDAVVYDPCAGIQNIPDCAVPTGPVTAAPGAGQWSNVTLGGPYQTPGQEQIFSFTASISGQHVINVSQFTGGNFVDFYWKEVGTCSNTGWNYWDDFIGTGAVPGDAFNGGVPPIFVSGHTYYIMWDPEDTNGNTLDFSITCPAPPPPNNNVCGALPLACNDVVTGNTTGLAPDLPANSCPFIDAPNSGGTLWYSYTPTQDENVTLSTCSANTDFDTRISVFTGPDCNTLSCYTMADDKDNSSCLLKAVLDMYVQNGVTYYIAVHSPGLAVSGNFELSLFCNPVCAPPANDVCSGAEAITSNLNDGLGAFTTGDNSCAMNDAFSTCQPYLNNQGLWYTFNAADNAIHYLDLHANAQDGGLSASTLNYTLYSGGCDGDLAASGEVVCALDAQADGILLPTLTPGTQYLLRIDNEGDVGFEGTFSLRLQHPPLDDAGITAVNAPVPGLLCTSTINAQVVLTNFGEHDLTSVEIHYDMDGLNPQVFNWSGNLPYLGTEVVDLPAFVSPYGIHTFNAYTANPNGATDEVPANDASAVAGVDVTGETLVVEVMTDNNPTGLVWEVDDASFLPVASGDGTNWAPNTLESTTVCLTTINGNHFRFFMFDVYGDGLSNTGNGDGYWRLLDENGQILIGDNFDGTIDGIVTPAGTPLTSTYTAHEFDLPVGPSGIPASDCNIFTNTLQNKVYANPVGGVAGYQWEFSDPDAGYIRRIARTYNWVKFGEMVTYPLLPGVTYFARVRVDQGAAGFSDDRWGPGCEMGIDPNQVPGCTSLIDNPNLPTHSCGVTKAFGGSDKIWAQPVVGATQYRFKFENADEGFLRIIAKPSYALVLNWVTYPLQNGVTYDVSVECLVNGQWSGYCGAVCQVTIMNPSAAPAARQLEATEGADMMLWPNPVRDGQVNIQLDGLTDQVHQVSIDVFDVFGKRVQSIQDDRTGKAYLTTVDMRGLAAGTYLVRVTVDGNIHQQRVTVL
ncbi:MAG: lamin tail domain-containing protein [Flavobacteriales bacterium]|nr:lamin tail domain-containing protein [Flavobacteriales bacterium]